MYKSIFKKIGNLKAHASFLDNIYGADLVYMLLINKFNKGFCFLLCAIDIHSKYVGFSFER